MGQCVVKLVLYKGIFQGGFLVLWMRLLDSCCASTPAQRGGAIPEKRRYVSQFSAGSCPLDSSISKKYIPPYSRHAGGHNGRGWASLVSSCVSIVWVMGALPVSLFMGLVTFLVSLGAVAVLLRCYVMLSLSLFLETFLRRASVLRWFGGWLFSRVHQA